MDVVHPHKYAHGFPLVFLALCTGCDRVVARVGDVPITSSDIALRARVSEVYYPGSGKDYVALSQLLKGYLSEEVLKSLDRRVDEAVLEAETRRIEAHTQAPEVLQRVKEVFGRDRMAYLKTFIRVVYAERVLYNEVFLLSKDIHKEQYSRAEALLSVALKTPASFPEIARDRGLEAQTLILSPTEGIRPLKEKRGGRPSSPEGVEQAARLISALARVKQGQVYPEVIEWQEGYQVIRYIRKGTGGRIIESVGIPKRGYDEWFWEKASTIPVRISDPALRETLVKEVSWAKNLTLQ